MNDKPKRKPWQIHLSTAVVMLIATNLVVLCNLHERFIRTTMQEVMDLDDGPAHMARKEITFYETGWPLTVGVCMFDGRHYQRWTHVMGHINLFFNLCFGLIVVLATAYGCEYLIRRRKPPA